MHTNKPRPRFQRLKRVALAALIVFGVALGLWFFSLRAAPLPSPPALDVSMPAASPPSSMAVFQIPTGVTHRSAAFAYRGGSLGDTREFSMTAVLVRHPAGDLLIDTGFGRNIDAHFQMMPFAFRAVTSYAHYRSAADQLEAAGYDRKTLRAILLTHAHWDHTSGLPDFPDTPVWVSADEKRFIAEGGFLTVVARTVPPSRYEEYSFEGGPYLGFPKSHDIFGDGSVVVVPAPGHTPGSAIVFLALPSGRRFALVGDLVWQVEGITEREERPWIQRTFGDVDPAGVRENLLRMAAIAKRFPDMVLVPAHDARGFAEMPTLSVAR